MKPRRLKMKFETIKGYMKRFNDLIDSCGGPDGMIERGIAWQKVAWGRTFGAGTEYVKIRPRKDAEGVWQLFMKRGKFWKNAIKKTWPIAMICLTKTASC